MEKLELQLNNIEIAIKGYFFEWNLIDLIHNAKSKYPNHNPLFFISLAQIVSKKPGFILTLIFIGCLLIMLSSFKIFKYTFVWNSVSFSLIVYQHSTGLMSNVRSGHLSNEQHTEYISRK